VSEATRLAARYTEPAIRTLAEVMTDPFAMARDRLRAAETLLDRGHGKPQQAVIMVPGDKAEIRKQLASMSDAELMEIVNESRLPRLTMDAEFTEISEAGRHQGEGAAAGRSPPAAPDKAPARLVPSGELEPTDAELAS
jgi:hypothetical protein